MAQLAQRLDLDLADTLARHREALADLLERTLAFGAHPEAEAENLLLLRRQRGQCPFDPRHEVLAQEGVIGRASRRVLEEVAQLRVPADGALKRERLP